MPVVPPGHRVVIIFPSRFPFFVPSESGPMMLNFGSVDNVPSALTKIAEWASSIKEQQSVVWLMPADILPAFDDAPVLLAQITNLVAAAPHISHLAVFPDSSPLQDRVMESFRSVGVNTQHGAPDGGCYIEIHKPDGSIVVGIPGPDSPVDESDSGTGTIDSLINNIADHNREDDFLELVSNLPILPLYFQMAGPVPENLPHGKHIVLEPEHIEFSTAFVEGLECVFAFTSPADPRLGPERVAMMEGLEALQMVLKTTLDGLLIQSQGTGWVVIQRWQIEQILSRRPKPTLLDGVVRLFERIFSKPKPK